MAAAANAAQPPPGAARAATATDGSGRVWKFGYGSNMSPRYLREKKRLTPLESRRTVLPGFALVFPQGAGIDFVEPSFATLRRDPAACVHGVSTLFSAEDGAKLDEQEGRGRNYNVCVAPARSYGSDDGADDDMNMLVEVYESMKPLAADHPQGPASVRYRNILVRGAEEVGLDAAWVQKLRDILVYTPSEDTMARRRAQPHPSALPQMTVAELKRHDGEGGDPTLDVYTCSCGYVFKHTPIFSVFRGRDVTERNVMHAQGINLDANDRGGVPPFPRLATLMEEDPLAFHYAVQYRDRFIAKAGAPVAALAEFWADQRRQEGAMARLQAAGLFAPAPAS